MPESVFVLLRWEAPADDMQILKIFYFKQDADRVLASVIEKNENIFLTYEVREYPVTYVV